NEPHSAGIGGRLRVSDNALGNGIRWIDKERDVRGSRHELAQKANALCDQFVAEKVDAAFAARPGKACYETKLDRVLPDGKHDGYRSGCGFRRECRSGSSGRGNHGYLPPRQIVSQLGQSTVIPVRPAEFDGNVVAFDVAGVAEALSKSGDDLR